MNLNDQETQPTDLEYSNTMPPHPEAVARVYPARAAHIARLATLATTRAWAREAARSAARQALGILTAPPKPAACLLAPTEIIEGCRLIPLSRAQFALVDPEDFEALSQYKWCAMARPDGRGFYAMRLDRTCRLVLMHRHLLNAPVGMQVDHIDGNGLHDWRANLRLATPAQNQQNRGMPANNISGFKGVRFYKEGVWIASIGHNGKHSCLGRFPTAQEASAAYIEAAKRLHGEFARW